MPRKVIPISSTDEPELDGFDRQVEAALEHFADMQWLGEYSPLAAPYMLGYNSSMAVNADNAQKRGEALCTIVLDAAKEIDLEFQTLLNLAFFQRNRKMDGLDLAIALHMSRRSFYRNRARAIRSLANCIQQRLQPALRLESPVNSVQLTGRDMAIQRALQGLQGGRSLYLFGPSGIGKTSLAAAIARNWAAISRQDVSQNESFAPAKVKPSVFWYTMRPLLNDQLSSFIFTLAYFLRGLGVTNVWRQLIADKGSIQPERILGLLRYDFSLLPVKPLLCIDEVDTLQPEVNEHKQLIHLIEELRKNASLLLIGQRVAIETDEQSKVEPLDETGLATLFVQAGIALPSILLREKLLIKTEGNPALLTLVLALLRTDDDITEIIADLSDIAALEALFLRMWRRLDSDERTCMMQLAVYRSPTPIDAYENERHIINRLLQRYLLQQDEQGAIFVLPHIRSLIYKRTPTDLRISFHLHALSVRSDRAQIVAAMHHALAANQPAHAVWQWFRHRTDEIERGQSATALNLLMTIVPESLTDERDRTALRISRAELQQLFGKPEVAEADLQAIALSADRLGNAYILQLQARSLGMQDRLDQSLKRYREGLEQLWGAPEHRATVLHAHLSFYYVERLQDITLARRESLLARVEAEIRHGRVEERAGNYSIAEERFTSACRLAEQVDNDLGIRARAYSHLGKLHLKQNNLDNAIDLIEKSLSYDQQRGDLVGPLYDRINLSYAFTLHGRYIEALQQAKAGLAYAEKMQNGYLVAGLAAAAGEATYALGQLAESEHYALQSLHQEEEFFRPWALTLMGMIRGKQGDIKDAVKQLHAAIQRASDIEDRYSEAYAWRKLGDVQRAAEQAASAQDAYRHALNLYRSLGLSKDVSALENLLQEMVKSQVTQSSAPLPVDGRLQ